MDHQLTHHTPTSENRNTALGSTGTPCCTQKTWKRLEILKTDQITQYRGLGRHHGSHLPLNMWHMYVTSRPVRLHQRRPVVLPSSGSGGQSGQCTPEGEGPRFHPDHPGNQRTQCKLKNFKPAWKTPELPRRNRIQPDGTQPPQNVHQYTKPHSSPIRSNCQSQLKD